MKRLMFSMLLVGAIVFGGTVRAELITHGSTSINMDFVTVGNPRNAADTRYDRTGYGRVDYTFRIGKYEVSETQWDTVSNASGTDPLDDSGYWSGNQPVADISWHEAAMFTNWLTSGDVTQGVYAISGGVVTGIDRASAQSTYGTIYYLPTEDEWYKAAYYDPNKPGGAGYWDYPTKHDNPNVPDGIDFAGDTTFDAVFYQGYFLMSPNSIDNAGVLSAYGTMGQGGNVLEWNETAVDDSSRGRRGGRWFTDYYSLQASDRNYNYPTHEDTDVGFRVASSQTVPEPSTLVGFTSLSLAGIAAAAWKRRKK